MLNERRLRTGRRRLPRRRATRSTRPTGASAAHSARWRSSSPAWPRTCRREPTSPQQRARALDEVAGALEQVDPDSLRVVDGAIDIDAISAVEAPLIQVQNSLAELRQATADVQSPWLLGALQNELADLTREFDDKEPRLQNAVDAVRLAPQILGADGTAPLPRAVHLTRRGPRARRIHRQLRRGRDRRRPDRRHRIRSPLRPPSASPTRPAPPAPSCPAEMLARYGAVGLDRGDGTFGSARLDRR